MKNKLNLVAFTILSLVSCSSDNDALLAPINSNSICNLTISANASSDNNVIEYPVSIEVYDEKGMSVRTATVTSASDDMSMELLAGKYTIVATSGDNDFSSGFTTSRPLMMGTKDINLSADMAEGVTLEYQVASVQVVLSDIDDNVTDVSVTIGPQYSAISSKGKLSGETSPTVSCSRTDDGKWITGTFYVLPGIGENTTITICQTSTKETKNFSIILPTPLEAGKPYAFNGSYNNSYAKYSLNVTISANGWGEGLTSNFEFNDNDVNTVIPTLPTNPDENPNTPSTDDKLTEGTIWNDHVVALIEGNTATLLSTKEWVVNDVEALPEDELKAYSENDITDWTIPTEEQGLKLAEKYHAANSLLKQFNTYLKENNVTVLNDGKETSTNIRYLCENGTLAYSYVNFNATVSVSNSSSYSYRIRLVKTITIK